MCSNFNGAEECEFFRPTVKYTGKACVEFQDPKVIIEGYAEICFDESNSPEARMMMKKIVQSDILIPNDLEAILDKPAIDTQEFKILISFFRQIKYNQCIKLEIQTQGGIFSAIGTNNIYCYRNNNFLNFGFLNSQFSTNKTETAKYWIIPLINFISSFNQSSLPFTNHPLLINKCRIITFRFNRTSGFIEPLPDYESLRDSLLNGQKQKTITSLIVGEMGDTSINLDDLDSWIPLNFLDLLGLATGTEVGAPWIEIRSSEGELIRRIHAQFNNPFYTRGHTSIDEEWNSGIANLLNCSQFSLHLGKSYTIAILKHLIHSGYISLTSEEKMTHLFQAFDCLCEIFDLSTQNLNQNLELSQKKAVATILQKARDDILSLANDANLEGDLDRARNLEAIAARARSNPIATDRNFGLCLSDLLHLFDLPDADILDHYYLNEVGKTRSWCNFLSHCRGVVIHKGYLDFYNHEFNHNEITIIIVINLINYT
jgi:hypothetical protein